MTSHSSARFLLWSYLEAFFYALMVGTAESFALFVSVKKGLSPMETAAVSTFPLLMGAFSQWVLPRILSEKTSRFGILGGMALQLVGILGLFWIAQKDSPSFPILFASLSCYWVGGMSITPLWMEWASSFVPPVYFREFLSQRTGFVNFTTLIFYLGTALALTHFSFLSSSFIFLLGFLGRLVSFFVHCYLTFHLSPTYSYTKKPETLPSEPGASPMPSLGLFILWTALFKWAVYIGAPFFLPYMLEELKLSILDYALLTGTSLFSRSIFSVFWGRLGVGRAPFWILPFTGFFISLIPLLWCVSRNIFYLGVLEFISGMFWAGFELACLLMIQNSVGEKKRQYFGKHMAIMNTFAVIGSYGGGLLVKTGLGYHKLFLFSFFCRFFVVAGFLVIFFQRKYIFHPRAKDLENL
jgi:hypothetical protein